MRKALTIAFSSKSHAVAAIYGATKLSMKIFVMLTRTKHLNLLADYLMFKTHAAIACNTQPLEFPFISRKVIDLTRSRRYRPFTQLLGWRCPLIVGVGCYPAFTQRPNLLALLATSQLLPKQREMYFQYHQDYSKVPKYWPVPFDLAELGFSYC